jgi:hypothetical protein
MLPPLIVVYLEIVRQAGSSGVTVSDVFRWIGVTVAVAGIVLATPDGLASLWHSVKTRTRAVFAFAERLLRRQRQTVAGGTAHGSLNLGGRARVETWQPWREDAEDSQKIVILHKQVVLLRKQIRELYTNTDRLDDDLHNAMREAERRVATQIEQLASEMRGERRRSSHVDARGLGPIAVGIILTDLPNELASSIVLGWIVVATAVIWIAIVTPGWLRDFRRALNGM